MKSRRAPLLVSVATLFAGPAWAHGDGPPLTSGLKYKAAPKWTIILPNETWTAVTGGIPIRHAGGDQFLALSDGKAPKLEVDTNADGKPDAMVKGTAGYVVLSGKNDDGTALSYAARFKADGTSFKFASSGWLQGTLDGVSIRLIDQNNNGRYDEFGVDAMVVGNGNAASYLSKVVSLNGKLHELSFANGGTEIGATPFTGETGTLNLAKGFSSNGNLDAAVVRSDDGNSFELSGGAMTVPVGRYRLGGGLVSKANETVRIGAGKSQPIDVEAGKEAAFTWGAEVTAQFSFSRKGDEISIEPTALKFYGKAGEEYLDFLPEGASPKFLVYDATTQKLLKTGRFGGC